MSLESPNFVDRHVGSRVRTRRLMLAMSETSLGDALGVTSQQVRRYESGIDRIDAGQLMQLAKILRVPMFFFFEDMLHAAAGSDESGALSSTSVSDTASHRTEAPAPHCQDGQTNSSQRPRDTCGSEA
jgi:transcriptional regulator with XRE-family HTH domain